MAQLRRAGIDSPSVPLAGFYLRPCDYGTSNAKTPIDATTYADRLDHSLYVLTQNNQATTSSVSDEGALNFLRANGVSGPFLQYIFFTEVGMTDSAGAFPSTPQRNGWQMSSVPWRTAIEYVPRAWLHLASTTATASASAGATSVSVADLASIQGITASCRIWVDVWNSTGDTYLGTFHATAKSATTGAGTLTVPASGYGSIGFDPSTVTNAGSTNPLTGAAWALTTLASIPNGAVLRCRVRSGSTGTGPNNGQHTIMADPTSTEFRSWTQARYTAYYTRDTSTAVGATNQWDGIFLDNLHTNAEKWLGQSNNNQIPGNALPTPYVATGYLADTAGTAWTLAQFNAAHLDYAAYVKQTLLPAVQPADKRKVWGNAYPQAFTDSAARAAILTACQNYRNVAGVDGIMLEDWPLRFPANGFLSRSQFLASLAYIDNLLSTGLGILAVAQQFVSASPTATGSSGANTISVSSATNIVAGQDVSGTGIGVGATVVSVVSTTVTLSVNNSGTVSGTMEFGVNEDSAIRYAYGAMLIAQNNDMDVCGRYIYDGYASHIQDDLNLLTLGRPVGSRRYDDNGTWERDYGGVGADGVTRVNATVRLFIPTGTVSVTNPPVLTIIRDVATTNDFVLGFTRPNATNTGVIAGSSLTVVNSDIVTTADGQVIEDQDVSGFIVVKHLNVTIRNCRVRGRDTGNGFVVGSLTLPATPSGSPVGDGAYARAIPTISSLSVRALIHTDASFPTDGLLIDRCTLIPDFPSWWCYGVRAQDGTTVNRCNIANCGDMISVRNGSATITGNYIHDSILFDMDYDQRSSSPAWWSHNDGVSVFGGSGTVIRGNSMNSKMTGARTGVMAAAGYGDLQYGASITVAPNNSAVKNLTVDKNWMSGGASCLQANATNTDFGWTGDDNVVGTITQNRVARDGHDFGSNSTYQIRYKSAGMFTTSGNVWDSDPVTVAYNAANSGVAVPGATLTVGFTGGIRIP